MQTTFFASIEAGLLQITTPDSKGAILSRLDEAANAGLIGALVVHANAGEHLFYIIHGSNSTMMRMCHECTSAIISFIGAFFLVRYELDEAKKEERNVKKHTVTEAPVSHSPDSERGIPFRKRTQEAPIKTDPVPGPVKINTVSSEPPIWSSNPHLVQVGPFRGQPPTHLLGRCHTLCIFLAFLGFVLALMGIVCFAWDRYPTSVSAFTTVCMGFCLIVGGAVLILPDFQTASST